MTKRMLVLVSVLTTLVACSSYHLPTSKIAQSEASVRAAQELGAQQHPQAALYLKMAEEEMSRGQALLHKGKDVRAEYAFNRARADADLSIAITQRAGAQAEAQQAADQAKQLQQPMNSQ